MTRKQALSILRPENNTLQALKQAYRSASLKHHPDHGGSTEIMALVNLAYETLNGCDWTKEDQADANKTTPLTETLQDMLQKASFPGVKAEIVGTWLWISGDTYTYREQLNAAGFRFSRNKSAWYFHENTGYRKFSRKDYTMNDIRETFGSTDLETEVAQGISA